MIKSEFIKLYIGVKHQRKLDCEAATYIAVRS